MTDDKTFASLDQRLQQQQQILQQRMQTLAIERQAASGDTTQFDEDLAELQALEAKLIKSRELVTKAHTLKEGDYIEVRHAPYRKLGIALMGLSFIGACALAAYAWVTWQ
ncbi:MAG TPA: hypothetical protein VIC08_00795 [Cellvibrionaceae bacterium]